VISPWDKHNPAVRLAKRFRWLVPALGIPLCIAAAGIGIQAAAFGRPPRDSLLAVAAMRELFRYRVMRGTQQIAGRRLSSVCIDGWFRVQHHRRLVRGSLVLLGNGERLYDVGYGIRRAGHRGLATPVDRAHFLLAGCPRYVGDRVSARLLRAEAVDADPTRARAKRATLAIVFGKPTQPSSFFVALPSYLSVGMQLDGSQVHGRSRLVPGGGKGQILRVERAFGVGKARRVHA
jgi:hypothetical protein